MLNREKERFIDERRLDRKALKRQLKNLSKQGDLRTNLKASLAAPDVNVIKEDDGDLESSSSGNESNANGGSEFNKISARKLSNRKISDVRSEDFKNIGNPVATRVADDKSMQSKSRAFSIF